MPKAKLYSHAGRTQTAAQWANELGILVTAFRNRIYRDPSTAFSKTKLARGKPRAFVKSPTHYTCNGETHTISEWAKLTGLSVCTVRERIKKGTPLDRPKGWKPSQDHKPMRPFKRPYFSLSNGGFLKAPPTPVALNTVAIEDRGVGQNFSTRPKTGRPSDARDFQPKSNSASDR
ncbi:hypothetical protein [Hyphomicrobium sp. MC1]|uniref:hypothetical protein n=1 Tax=Hyphomicrobium sp. (strain MC1) TaxID=717785 RepID=UPI000213EB27|nr:hypothetical protein [Hyphomicrobium sp. MC1]CCB65394.1 protein of unknown function [Hyphomicrobium sp. MC1]